MLLRALPLFYGTMPFFAMTVVIFRNLHAIVSAPQEEEHELLVKNLMHSLSTFLDSVPLPQVLQCFHGVVLFHASSPQFQKRLVKTLKTQVGVTAFTLFLNRGREGFVSWTQTQNAEVRDELRDVILQWQQLFSTLFHNMTGQFASLFRLPLTPAGAFENQAQPNKIWDFVIMVAANANRNQKQELYLELKPLLSLLEPTQQSNLFLQMVTPQAN